MRLLLDSDVLIALSKGDDSNHQKIIKFFKKEKKPQIYISHMCIAEICTILSIKISQESAVAFLKSIRQRNITEIAYSQQLRNLADKIFMAQATKHVSWIDCYNVAIMQVEKLDALVSFDKFYGRFDFDVLP